MTAADGRTLSFFGLRPQPAPNMRSAQTATVLIGEGRHLWPGLDADQLPCLLELGRHGPRKGLALGRQLTIPPVVDVHAIGIGIRI